MHKAIAQHLIKYADPILRGSRYFYGILNNALTKRLFTQLLLFCCETYGNEASNNDRHHHPVMMIGSPPQKFLLFAQEHRI